MQILSKGWKLPETGDFGDVWFVALEDNISLSNTHNHNGVNSEKINQLSITSTVTTVDAGDFVDQGDGYWRASVPVPSGLALDNFSVVVKDPATKDQVYLKMTKQDVNHLYLYTNFVQSFEVYFGV